MSFEPDIIYILNDGLARLVEIKHVDDYVRVVTHCMYPSNGLVTVAVRSGKQTAVVSDEGGALSEATSAGIVNRPSDKQLSSLIASQGLTVKNGVIIAPPVPLDAAPAAVLLVANAAKDLAGWLYSTARVKHTRDFKKALAQILRKTFDENLAAEEIPGRYKPRKFSNVVRLPHGKKLIVDPVMHEASSINARLIANLDVKQAGDHKIIQRLVYDDEEEWGPDDLALLGMTDITVVPFSRSVEVMRRIAASA